ncbi:MAG: hypothetical protein HKP08_07165 [Flavobacteriaceae bacterium]|nr:hypothetical protein [Flavobacteriaceae bacterium]
MVSSCTFPVRFSPFGVNSYNQVSTRAMGKPTNSTLIKLLATASGQPRLGPTVSTTWMSSQAVIA